MSSPFVLTAEAGNNLPDRSRDLDRLLRIAFIRFQLKSGTTFAELARTEHTRGDRQSSETALLNGDLAWREARHWIRKAEELGIDVAAERQESEALGQMLLDVQDERL